MKKLSVLTSIIFFISSFNTLSAQAKMQLHFVHCVNDTPAVFNQLIYTNRAGNKYMLKDLQYFISDVRLYTKDGSVKENIASEKMHYADAAIPSSLVWQVAFDTGSIKYAGISFRFGIAKEKNKSFLFKNPPANLMAWPETLGGGYHYMKLNLKFIDSVNDLSNFNCHLGLGITDKPKEYIDNSFFVKLPFNADYTIHPGSKNNVIIQMNLNKWFDGINTMDMNAYDGIMDNELAMKQFCENGLNVFVLKPVQ